MMLVSILIKTNENLENSYMKSSAKEDYHKRRKELFFSSHTCLNLISRSMPMEKYPEIDCLLTKQDLKELDYCLIMKEMIVSVCCLYLKIE